MKRLLFGAALAMVMILFTGAANAHQATQTVGDRKQAGDKVLVKIDNFSFSPATVTVNVGTTVTWVNRDDIPHNVISAEKEVVLKSAVLDTDEAFHYTFTEPGEYPYFCGIHPKMTGKIIVR